jgi:hypothetical protein
MEWGGNEIFSYIHPKMLGEAIHKKTRNRNNIVPKWAAIYDKILPTLLKAIGLRRLYDEKEIIVLLVPLVSGSEIEKIEKELWRGTYAAIVYAEFRNPSVHGLGPASGITFNNTTFKDQSVPTIDFELLYNALNSIATIVKDKSIKSRKLAGFEF